MTMVIAAELIFGPHRYTGLDALVPGVSPNVLADRLRKLQRAGLVERRLRSRGVVYSMTELGPIFAELRAFGPRHLAESGDNETYDPPSQSCRQSALPGRRGNESVRRSA